MNAPFAARPLVKERSEFDELLVAPSRERRRLQCYLALVLADICSIFLGFAVIGYLL